MQTGMTIDVPESLRDPRVKSLVFYINLHLDLQMVTVTHDPEAKF
jgi:hypothetical protein